MAQASDAATSSWGAEEMVTTRMATVRNTCGAYVTNTILGARASCTVSAEQALQALLDKLAKAGHPARAEAQPSDADHLVRRWLLHFN